MDLVEIAPGHQLDAPAAASWKRAVAAGCPVAITSSYRSPERQAQMRAEYVRELAAWQARPVGSKPTFVARVEDSEHVTGNALDLKDPAIAWMRAHPDYGFRFTDSSERWHVAYRFANDKHLTPTPPPLTPLEEDDMSAAAEKQIAEIHRMLGAGGALDVNGGAGLRVEDTIGYRVGDVQLALTKALPILLADAAHPDADAAAIAAAVVAAIPANIAQGVLDGLAKRLQA